MSVIDGQRGATAEPDEANGFIASGQPEILDLHILVADLAFFRPKRRVLCGLGLNARDREVSGVDPYLSAIKILAFSFRCHGEHVLLTVIGGFHPQQREVVVGAV